MINLGYSYRDYRLLGEGKLTREQYEGRALERGLKIMANVEDLRRQRA